MSFMLPSLKYRNPDKQEWLLAGILCLGLALRIYDLTGESLWLDEGYSLLLAGLDVKNIIHITSTDVHPPLYYLLLHCWTGTVGNSEFMVRLFSALLGFLSVFLIYDLGKRLFTREAGLAAALFLAVCPFHVQYSQEVRMYSLMVLLAQLSMLFFWQWRQAYKRRFLAGYLLSSAALLYTHNFAVFLVLGQNLLCLWRSAREAAFRKQALQEWILAQLFLIVLYLPWLRILVSQAREVKQGYWMPVPDWRILYSTFTEYSGSAAGFLLLLGMLLFAGRDWLGRKTENKDSAAESWLVLSAWLGAMVLIPYAVSQLGTSIYISRVTIAALSAFLLLAAGGWSRIPWRWLQAVLVGLYVFSASFSLHHYYSTLHKEQWRETAGYIESQAQSGDLLLFNAGYGKSYVYDYYSRRDDVTELPFPADTPVVNHFNIKALEPLIRDKNRVWLIYAFSKDDQHLILKRLTEVYGSPRKKDFFLIEIFFFEKQTNV